MGQMAKPVCPHCGSEDVAVILYGMPAFTKELERQLEAGEVALGGCEYVIDEAGKCCNPTHRCNECEEEFGTE